MLQGESTLLTTTVCICLPAFMDSPQVHAGKGGVCIGFFRQESEEQPRDTPWELTNDTPLWPDRPEE